MPLPTSDFHNPVCLEMKSLKNGVNNSFGVNPSSFGFSTTTLPLETPLRHLSLSNNNNNYNNNFNNNGELGSVDSSDTYASCQTHPFLSQADLTSDVLDGNCSIDLLDTNNLYINPLEKDNDGTLVRSQVKKSASGDTGLRSLGASPMDEEFQNFQSFGVDERGSRVSLNEMTPVPKHRKTRFQQSCTTKPRARFEDTKTSQDSLNEGKKIRRSSFMPAKSLASATKLINQHLFGIQNIGSKKKNDSKLSLSIDSIDASPQLETHRRSKSILKNKSETSRLANDPESERLLSDNMSGLSDNGAVVGDSNSDYSPNKLPHPFAISASVAQFGLKHRTLIQQRSTPANLGSKTTKFQTPRLPEESFTSRQIIIKPQLQRSIGICGGYIDHLTGDGRLDSFGRDSSLESETASSSREIRDEGCGSGDETRSLIARGSSLESRGQGCDTNS